MACIGFSVCFCLSCRDVISLLTPGGAISARIHTFSTDVGLRHPVMGQYASFRAGSSFLLPIEFNVEPSVTHHTSDEFGKLSFHSHPIELG